LRAPHLSAHARQLPRLGGAEGLRGCAILLELRSDVRDERRLADPPVPRLPDRPEVSGQGHRHERNQVTMKNYALVGVGSRAQMYLEAIAGEHADVARLVAWADTNPGRMAWSAERFPGLGEPAVFGLDLLADAVRE